MKHKFIIESSSIIVAHCLTSTPKDHLTLMGMYLSLNCYVQYFGHLMHRTDSLEKTRVLGKIEEEKGMTEDEMGGWHHWHNGHEFEQALGDGETQGSLTCCSLVQFSSVTQSCPTLCDPMDCSMPSLPVHHQLPEFTQTHVHWVDDAIQPSHPLSSPSPTFNLSQHQGLFQWVSSVNQVDKVLL